MFKYRPDEAIAVPVNIQPHQTKGVWRDFLPGVRLTPYVGKLREVIEQVDTNAPPQASLLVARSHLLLIRPTIYLSGVRERIRAESGNFPKDAIEMVDPSSLARQCLVASILTARSRCAYASYYTLKRRSGGWIVTGMSNQAREETSLHVFGVLRSENLDLRQAKQLALKLDRYYREISWWTDRIGIALGYFWEGLCAPYPAQTYISLIVVIDALVGTRNSGGHALGERVAVMLGTDPKSRLDEYRKMMALYRVRNPLVHGSAHPRKGRQTNQSLWVGAKRSYVPNDDMSKLIDVCVRLIRRGLEDSEYLSLVQTQGTEEKIDDYLDVLFLERLLGAS